MSTVALRSTMMGGIFVLVVFLVGFRGRAAVSDCSRFMAVLSVSCGSVFALISCNRLGQRSNEVSKSFKCVPSSPAADRKFSRCCQVCQRIPCAWSPCKNLATHLRGAVRLCACYMKETKEEQRTPPGFFKVAAVAASALRVFGTGAAVGQCCSQQLHALGVRLRLSCCYSQSFGEV